MRHFFSGTLARWLKPLKFGGSSSLSNPNLFAAGQCPPKPSSEKSLVGAAFQTEQSSHLTALPPPPPPPTTIYSKFCSWPSSPLQQTASTTHYVRLEMVAQLSFDVGRVWKDSAQLGKALQTE
jgi:hypothetical protein